jgi:hypothetical protein
LKEFDRIRNINHLKQIWYETIFSVDDVIIGYDAGGHRPQGAE